MRELRGGWRRAPRWSARLGQLSEEELAREPGPEAQNERDLRAREDACDHPRPRRMGRSVMLHCSACGAQWSPPVPASGGPPTPILSTGHLVTAGLHNEAEWRAARARGEAQLAVHRASLFPAAAIAELISLVRALRRVMASKGAGAEVLERFDYWIGSLERALRDGKAAADQVAEGAHQVESSTRMAEEAARGAMELIQEIDGETLDRARKAAGL